MILSKINDYTPIKLIGKGGFGDVYLVHSVDKDQYALKLIPVTRDNKVQAKQQAELYVQLKHPNILKAREFFYFSQETFLAIVLEYCPGGSLANLIGNIDQLQTKRIIKQIVQGLVYIHRKEIVHRDIKLQNILMMDGVPKITDLGLAKTMRTSGVSGKSGTPFYEAYEVLFQEKYGQAADIWSLGIVILQLLLGQRIFKLVKGTMPPSAREGFPSQSMLDEIKDHQLRDLVRKMLVKIPEERLSIEQVFDYLNGKCEKKQNVQIQQKKEDSRSKSIEKVHEPVKAINKFAAIKQKELYKFSSQQKAPMIQLSNNNFTASKLKTFLSPDLVLIEGVVVNEGSSIRFKMQKSANFVFIGLGIRNLIVSNSYKIRSCNN